MSANSKWLTALGTILVSMVITTQSAQAQTLTTLHSFDGTDGLSPNAGLIQGTDGNLYGTTVTNNATNPSGTVFKITPIGKLTTLYNFCSQPHCTDGNYPFAGLIEATNGNFYGTTTQGATDNSGTVFQITPSGTLTTLYHFCSQLNSLGFCLDGGGPYAGLIPATDGNFYGTTVRGGAYNDNGTVFKITPAGTLTTLYSFCPQTKCTDGDYPAAGLIQATDGNFYGTTVHGGANAIFSGSGGGTVFKITPSGTLTTLYSFCSHTRCEDGTELWAGLIQATNGNLYGTTAFGGANAGADCTGGCGTVFKITPTGTLTTLYSFCAQTNSLGHCVDGEEPLAGLIQAADGNLYGTTFAGGANNAGTVFKITPTGVLTTLHSFDGRDGSLPAAGLIQATDGNLYGTTVGGGTNGAGTVFRLSIAPASKLAALLTEVTGIGPGKSLANKVALAQTYYAAKDLQATCAMLTAFVHEVRAQNGKKIGQTLDAKLTADAHAIEVAIGCN